MVEVKFWKMHGLGNDFIVVDNRNNRIADAEKAAIATKLCDRRFGVGADGLLLLSNSATADVKMEIFNADGSEAEMCGNGIRCFAKYCYENGLVTKREFAVETLAGNKRVWLTVRNNEVESVKVDMGKAAWERSQIPMTGKSECIDEELRVDGEKYRVTCLSLGNPHCVTFVSNVDDFPVDVVGPKIENHKVFPNKTNVEFVQILNKNEMKARVWERGCGETFACGTGACASAAAAEKLKKTGSKVTVHLRGGDLRVELAKSLFMDGPAAKVFEGTLFKEANGQ